jgi:arabinose-5-phosphate isomerase
LTESALRHSDSNADPAVASAARVLRLEAEGLNALSGRIGQSFIEAVDALGRMTGRAIVTGMGKSGHVARKIAATLASTGTPAVFVHPAEASHGDLGMIAKGDVVIALSNSGETPELADIVTYAKRYEIPLVAITGKKDSALGRAADVVLVLADTAEACPMGLAPTTSTTMMLGLGDALAVALLERKGFSADDFHVLHPGGKLGRMLLRVADIMHTGESVPLIGRDAKMAEALIAMTAKSFGCIGIIGDQGRLVGIITDGDLRRHMRPDLADLAVAQVMTQGAKAIAPDALASEALGLMNARGITNLFVVDDGRPIGIVHIHDCLRAGVA